MASWFGSLSDRFGRRASSDVGPRRSLRGNGVRDGNPGVFYDDNGRIFYGSRSVDTHVDSSSLPKHDKYWRRQMRPDDTFTYDPRKTSSGPRSYEFTRGVGDTPRSSGRSIIAKHYDGYKYGPHMQDYGPARAGFMPVVPIAPVESYRYKERYVTREGSMIVEERIVSHARPWIWPLFLLSGFLLFGCGAVNALFCEDTHWYSFLWVPLFVLIASIFGALHRGKYRGRGGRWRNWGYIISGIIATIFIIIGCGMLQMRLNHVSIQIAEFGPGAFVTFEKNRMDYLDHYPTYNLTGGLDTNIWACYALDWVALILFTILFSVLASVVIVANNFYNSNHEYRREVDPFNRPALFNPWGQVILGEAMVYIGIVMKTSVHGNYEVRWQDYWVPVWCGIFPMAAGFVSAFALKRIGLRHGKSLSVGAIILELFSFIACAIVMGFTTFSMYENILAFQHVTISTTDFSKELLTASVFIFVSADVIIVLNVLYSLALLIKVATEARRKDTKTSKRQQYIEERYGAERYPEKFERDVRDERGDFIEPVHTYREDRDRY